MKKNSLKTVAQPTQKKGWLTEFFNVQKIVDGWSNIITGLGTKERDARNYSTVTWRRMSETEIEEFYAGDAMAAKVVDLPVEESTEKGYKLTGITTEQEKKVKAELARLHFDECIVDAARKARLYGGSAILKVYDDDLILDAPAIPLYARSGDVTGTRRARVIKSLVSFQRFELYSTWEDVNKDILSSDFGHPRLYTFIGRSTAAAYANNIKIHYSRLVRFDGAWLPDKLRQSNQYWHDTVLSKLYDAIRNYANAHDSVNAALKDVSTAVFKIKGLADQVLSDCDDKVLERLQLVNLTKSIARAVVLDAEGEDFDYKVRNMSGVEKLVESAEKRLTAETGMPHTVLLGNSPTGGLGQSGNHESTNWNKWISSYQETKLKPQMLEIIKEVAASISVPVENLDIEFNPLDEPSEKEIVETRNKQASTDQIYMDAGVLDPVEVRESRFGGEKYSVDTSIDKGLDPEPKKNQEEFDLANPVPPNQVPPNPQPNPQEET